jgi:hypothetical protein
MKKTQMAVSVRMGQYWRSNDPRRPTLRVRVVGRSADLDLDDPTARVHVRNVSTGRYSTIRRDQFNATTRGWTLDVEE